mgnify:CR=1 FL=1
MIFSTNIGRRRKLHVGEGDCPVDDLARVGDDRADRGGKRCDEHQQQRRRQRRSWQASACPRGAPAAQRRIGHVDTTIMADQIVAARNGRRIQTEAAMSPPMMRTASTVRVRSRRRSCSHGRVAGAANQAVSLLAHQNASAKTECRRRSPRCFSLPPPPFCRPRGSAAVPSRRLLLPPPVLAPANSTSPPLAAGIATAKQLHPVGDDFGRIFFDAVLVRVLACLQAALDIDGAALLQIFAGDLSLAPEQHDARATRCVPAFRRSCPSTARMCAIFRLVTASPPVV